ncbi:DUF1819 family protein [Clostridium botulinum]|uniref:DUF1819 family protein n=1 Tax=Clostridium botulinum TaxID=1491 RepID=UPI000772F2DF|nr:DUF1819 family protein [Clostridium botulinum]MBN1062359.1 DUF1819 family protein [Clostridium botulinum]MBY6930667.1 DUF1819 family protein [Clostridium botulinum]NFG21857.1 DUF1819 family protein [Clostridium botulinum]NFO79746.1 DUF1819 family protein [Clostridium botulinum]
MELNKSYSAKLTGESFLLYEFKIVAKLKKEGFSDKDIRKMVLEENLFQYKFKSSITRRLTPLLQRVNIIDDILIDMLIDDPLGNGVIINLYAIMKNDRLFFEFMNEVVKEKLQNTSEIIEKKDINIYFEHKAEQNEVITKWSDATIQKLKQVIKKILSEAKVINLKTGEVHKLIMSQGLKEYLIKIGDTKYVVAMGENL